MARIVVGVLTALVVVGMVLFLYFGFDLGSDYGVAERPRAAVQERSVPVDAAVKTILPAEVKKWLDSGKKFAFIDVRSPEEFEKWRIPQAVLVPIEPRETFVDRLRRHVPDQDREVVLFCRTGRRSEDAAVLMAKRGYGRAFNMGGIIDWNFATEGRDI